MNILQLVPKLNIGGVEKSTIEIARHLALNGHKAVVVSGGGRLERDLAAIGARHYNLPVGRKNPFSMVYSYFKLRQVIKRESIDIVHARSRIPALVGYFAARSTKRTFITTAHGHYKKHLISRVMGWGKVVIVASEMMARHMKDNFGVSPEKMVIIPRGVDLNRFSFIPPSRRKGKVFRIGMISRYTPLKGHVDFLKAMSRILRKRQDVEVILMGDRAAASSEYVKRIDLAIKRFMPERKVRFVESGESVAEVLRELDILVSANREQEAFGRSIIEAQARGVPVVATRVGGAAENVEDGVTGLLCEPSDPTDMAGKITAYLEDPALMEKIAVNARKYVKDNYSLDDVMEKTLATYKQALNVKKILVFKISSLGDVILSIPSVRAIREKFRKAAVKVLVDVKFREVFDGCPYLDEVITCDFKGRDKGLGLFALAKRLSSEGFDISIDLQNNRKSHLLAFLSGIPERYGYDNRKWSLFLNRKTPLPEKSLEPIKHQARVLGLLGVVRPEPRLELWESKEGERWADDFLRDNWLKKDQKLVAFSLSASKRWKTKNWEIGKMVELADILAERKGMRVVLLGTDDDEGKAREFVKKTAAKPINAVGKTSISRLVSLVKRCDALVTGDSSPMHVAVATGTPFVAIFGPTDPDKHLSPAKGHKVIYKKLECSPCYKPVCAKGGKCISDISTHEVFDALMEVVR
ncbi:MAG: lipopolysaccharide heptosyltransferase II [Candidatus Omnitrophota bacterium]|jgi:lipopolysaccharide heptosyltransferase II